LANFYFPGIDAGIESDQETTRSRRVFFDQRQHNSQQWRSQFGFQNEFKHFHKYHRHRKRIPSRFIYLIGVV
jgi:hypothetical protein